MPERFWAQVAKSGPTDCWPWQGFRKNGGYGVFSIGTSAINRSAFKYAHRMAWELTNGPIPDGMSLLHSCDNPPCCNPSHLSVGTQRDNNIDRDTKDRVRHGETHSSAKLSVSDVRQIRELYATGNISHRKLARAFGVSHQTVAGILKGEFWRRA